MRKLLSKGREWFVDSTARKPSGWVARIAYAHPWGHYKAFRLTLEKLNLQPDDVYLEIGQGGGELLKRALQTVKKAAAIDHSAEMVETARKKNREAVDDGRVEIVQGDAESLPWPDDSFTCAACAETFSFFQNPAVVLNEAYRVLRDRGRLAIVTPRKFESRLVKALLFPWLKSMRLYSDTGLAWMLAEAGFEEVEVKSLAFHQICYGEKRGATGSG